MMVLCSQLLMMLMAKDVARSTGDSGLDDDDDDDDDDDSDADDDGGGRGRDGDGIGHGSEAHDAAHYDYGDDPS